MKRVSYIIVFLVCFLVGFGGTISSCQTSGDLAKSDRNDFQSSEERKRAWQKLLSLENQDLSKIDDRELYTAVSVLVGENGRSGDLTVFAKISNEKGQVFYALIGQEQLVTIPGNSELFVNIFDLEGSHMNAFAFNAGWRISLRGQKVVLQKEIAREAIVVSSEPVINGRDVRTQYYALIGTDLRLIRLENSKGESVRNNYEFPNKVIGPTIANRSKEVWEKSLGSNDIAEILASLMWINGLHRDLSEDYPSEFRVQQESVDQVKLVDSIRKGAAVRNLSQRFLGKDMKWLIDSIKQK